MQTISDTFKSQLVHGYQAYSKVEIYSPGGNLLADSSTFNVETGKINVDGTANYCRSLNDLTIVDALGTYIPQQAADIFSPISANEMRIYTGMYVGGVPEFLPQGVFALNGAEVDDTGGDLTIKLTVFDRAWWIDRHVLTAPYTINNGTNTMTAITTLLQFARPGTLILMKDPDPGFTMPYTLLDEGTQPWSKCQELAQSIGFEMFFDQTGIVVMRKVIDPDSKTLQTAWTYKDDQWSVLTDVKRTFSNDDAFNGQIVTGENPYNITPARGEAWDTDPTSPTYYLGPYGKVPEYFHDSHIATNAQAVAAATARLNLRKGAREIMEFQIVPNHAHEYGDVVALVRSKTKVNNQYILDKFDIDLAAKAGPMQITCRQRRVLV